MKHKMVVYQGVVEHHGHEYKSPLYVNRNIAEMAMEDLSEQLQRKGVNPSFIYPSVKEVFIY